jgi:hypothetical protein
MPAVFFYQTIAGTHTLLLTFVAACYKIVLNFIAGRLAILCGVSSRPFH